MKRLIYLLAGVGLLGGFAACDDDNENPGDFSLKSTLELGTITSARGHVYPLEVAESYDTVYEYFYTAHDTVYNEFGEVQFDEFGDTLVNHHEASYFSKKKAKLYRMKQVVLFGEPDTLTIPIISNAQWDAPQPKFMLDDKAQTAWFDNYQSSTAGGGNSRVRLTVMTTRRDRAYSGYQTVLTRDSMVMYIIPFQQVGRGTTPPDYDMSLEQSATPAE